MYSIISDTTLRVVKWMDTKTVTLLTSFDSAQPVSSVERYDRSSKRRVQISCLKAVSTYNEHMGGVDLLNFLTALHRFKLQSKKNYHRLFFHFVDMTVVTCWLLYKRDCDNLGLPKKKQLPLLKFKHDIAEALYKQGKVAGQIKRGRPSSTSIELMYEAKKKMRGHNSKPIPQTVIRKENTDHFPIYKEKRA